MSRVDSRVCVSVGYTRRMALTAAMLLFLSTGFVLQPSPQCGPRAGFNMRRAVAPTAALDMNNKDVAEEYAAVMAFDTEQIEDELAAGGIVAPPTMNDFELRSMLVEYRMMKSGKGGAKKAPAPKPTSFSNEFERTLYEKPAFKALYDRFQNERLQNEINLCIEYMNDRKRAKERYGGTAKYDETVAAIEEALAAKVEQVVKSGKLLFSGFPSNMGETAVRMTLEGFGSLKDFTCEESDDGMSLTGRAEFEKTESAKAAIDKYDGVDMGLGTTLELQAL